MSKIEKALNRAATERHLTVARTPTDVVERLVRDEQGVPAGALVRLEARARSNEAIALMRESDLRSKEELAQARIIHPEMGENPTVKAMREIRTKILQKTLGQNAVVMVTSLLSRSGTTFIALNLSAAFAFDVGKTALLVDCNLRYPGLHRLSRNPSAPGLTDYLENPQMDIAEIIHPIGIPRLRVIPAGGRREIPAEYFTSVKMKQLVESIRTRYAERFIVLDAPPLTESADTQILAELCDLIILVVPYGAVTSNQIDVGLKAIDRNKLLGVVFNNEPQLPRFRGKR